MRHGFTREDISHAHDIAVYGDVLDQDDDPPKLLFIGPTSAGNLLELVGGDFESGDRVIWHAMACRPQYSKLLSQTGPSR